MLGADLAAWRTRAGNPLVEIRGEMPVTAASSPVTVAVRHVLPLEADTSRVFGTFKRSQVQRNIRRAEREGVRVEVTTSLEDLAVFYRLHLWTRRRLGVPVQPKRFLVALWEKLVAAGFGFAVVAYKGSRAIAGAVFLAWNETVVYKYGASDARYWSLRSNNLTLWTAIQWACENGYREFDFGRSDLDDHGLRAFKDGWGTTELPLVYSYCGDVLPRPVPNLERRLVGKVIRYSPALVCRGVGELFYGHFG
jgi:CelD/BcsL family acetyltransferase involved in cellulose biosynthesis